MAGLSTPPADDAVSSHAYIPGSNPTAEAYDLPEGSQGQYDPDRDQVPDAGSDYSVFGDADQAFTNSPLNPVDRDYVNLPGTDFNEDDGYITSFGDDMP